MAFSGVGTDLAAAADWARGAGYADDVCEVAEPSGTTTERVSYADAYVDDAPDPNALAVIGALAAEQSLAQRATRSHTPYDPFLDDVDVGQRLRLGPDGRATAAQETERQDAVTRGGGIFAPPPVRDSSIDPKCLTPEGERAELERRYGRPFTAAEVEAYRRDVGGEGARHRLDSERATKNLYADGQMTSEERHRELAGRALAVLASGPLAAMAYGLAGGSEDRRIAAGQAAGTLEQMGSGVVALAGPKTAHVPPRPDISRADAKRGPQGERDRSRVPDRGLSPGRGYRPKPEERATKREEWYRQQSEEREAKEFRPAKGGGQSAANADRHRHQLAKEQAKSEAPFNKDGSLKPDAIRTATEIRKGTQLKNPELIRRLTSDGSDIRDWGKYSTKTFDTPSGPYQVHFYYNPVTGKVNLQMDYKSVRNDRG